MRRTGKLLIVTLLLTGGARLAAAHRVMSLQGMDQNRFVGRWYEVARYPYKREKTCVSNTVLLVAMADKANQMQLVNSCEDKKGYEDVRHSTARGPKPKVGRTVATAEFKVTTVFPFSTKMWVLALAADDTWAVVGSPDHKHLWIFSKTAAMTPEMYAEARSVASREGYDLGKLTLTPVKN